jgi:hypothetical protein
VALSRKVDNGLKLLFKVAVYVRYYCTLGKRVHAYIHVYCPLSQGLLRVRTGDPLSYILIENKSVHIMLSRRISSLETRAYVLYY